MIARLFDRAACVVQGPCIRWGAYLFWGEKEKLERLNERVLPLPTSCGIWISEKAPFSLLHCLLLFVRQGIPPLVSSMGPLTKFRLHGRSSATCWGRLLELESDSCGFCFYFISNSGLQHRTWWAAPDTENIRSTGYATEGSAQKRKCPFDFTFVLVL